MISNTFGVVIVLADHIREDALLTRSDFAEKSAARGGYVLTWGSRGP